MKNRTDQRLKEITASTLIVGVDVAKSVHWARFVDYRGMEMGYRNQALGMQIRPLEDDTVIFGPAFTSIGTSDDNNSTNIVHAAIDLGINLFDVAPVSHP